MKSLASVVIGAASDAPPQMHRDCARRLAGVVSAKVGFDVAVECLACGFAAGVSVIDVEQGLDRWPAVRQAVP